MTSSSRHLLAISDDTKRHTATPISIIDHLSVDRNVNNPMIPVDLLVNFVIVIIRASSSHKELDEWRVTMTWLTDCCIVGTDAVKQTISDIV